MTTAKKKPRSGNCGVSMDLHPEKDRPRQYSGGRRRQLPANWRERLPDPAAYYTAHIAKLSAPNAAGWAQGRCPFHEDHNASFSVNVRSERGGWRCFSGCGSGDLLSFHMRRSGLLFADAVAELLGMRA